MPEIRITGTWTAGSPTVARTGGDPLYAGTTPVAAPGAEVILGGVNGVRALLERVDNAGQITLRAEDVPAASGSGEIVLIGQAARIDQLITDVQAVHDRYAAAADVLEGTYPPGAADSPALRSTDALTDGVYFDAAHGPTLVRQGAVRIAAGVSRPALNGIEMTASGLAVATGTADQGRTALELGSLAQQAADSVAVTGGTLDGVAVTAAAIDGGAIGETVPPIADFATLSVAGVPVALADTARVVADHPPTLAIVAEPGQPLAGVEVTAVGTRWSVGPDGRLHATPPGTLRDDYDPLTGAYRGKLIEAESRTNHLTHSTRFEGWTAIAAGAADFAAAGPDGARSAAAIVETTASGVHYVEQVPGLPDDTVCAISVYARSAGRDLHIWLADAGWASSAGAVFDLLAGAVRTIGAGSQSARITAHRDGWWRCEVVARTTAAPGPRRVRMALHNGSTSSYAGDGASGVLLWQAQAEVGAFATSPIPTGAATATRVAEDVRVPIHGYAGGPAGAPGANLITPGPWTATAVTVDGDVAEAPLGLGQTADRLTDTAAVGEHGIDTDVTVAGGDAVAFAAFVRFDTVARVRLRLGDTAGTDRMTADFTAAGLAATSEGGAALLHGTLFRRHPGGWFRVGLRGVIDPDSTTARCAIRLHDGSGVSYAGGTGTLYTAAAQATVGAAFTPFDAVDAGHWYAPAEGTLLVEGDAPAPVGATGVWAGVSGGLSSQSLYAARSAGDRLQIGQTDAPTGLDIDLGAYTGAATSIAWTYAATGAAGCADGGAVVTDPDVTPPADVDRLILGAAPWGTAVAPAHGRLLRLEYRPRPLVDADLQALTRRPS